MERTGLALAAASTPRRVLSTLVLLAASSAAAQQPMARGTQADAAAAPAPFVLEEALASTGPVLALPSSGRIATGRVLRGDVAIDVQAADGMLAYRAIRDGRVARAHAQIGGPPVYFAYDPADHALRPLASTIRVELRDGVRLEPLVRALGAVSGKAYPELGFALVRVSPGANPALAARRLAEQPGVRSANVRFKRPRERKLPPRRSLPPRRTLAPRQSTVDSPTAPDAPTVRAGLRADLLVFFDGVYFDADGSATGAVSVYNWGAASARATRLTVALARDRRFANVVSSASVNVPALASKGSYAASLPLDTSGLGAATYFVRASVPVQSAEVHGRDYTNSDYAGFRLDGAGRALAECRAAGRGGQVGVGDPLFLRQWQLNNVGQTAYADGGGVPDEDMALNRILALGPTGKDVRVAVVDTGLETCHPDLAANVELDASFNFNAGLSGKSAWSAGPWHDAYPNDPFNPYPVGDHGTSVAGLVAAEARNGIGGRGVAHGALLRGYNMLNALDYDLGVYLDALGASRYAPDSSDVDVFNMSFGSLGYPNNAGVEEEALFAHGVRRLRDGRGAIYVKAAGNGFNDCAALFRAGGMRSRVGCVDANGDATNNLPYVMVVGGFNADGHRASYASSGANLWVTAPAGEYGVNEPAMVTTDQAGGSAGYGVFYGDRLRTVTDVNPHQDYTSLFNGTSSAAPNASGVVAILLEAVPALTWREVKHLLASTARRIDRNLAEAVAAFGGDSRVVRRRWFVNDAGYQFHNWYGFGAIHATRALAAARDWVPGSLGRFQRSGWFDAGASAVAIPDNAGEGVTRTLAVAGLPAFADLEAVVLEVDLDHPFPYDLAIELTSPEGTPSIVNPIFNEVLAMDRTGAAPLRWRLLSNAFYGEPPNGDWKLNIYDGAAGETGSLAGWRLRFYYGHHTPVAD